LGKLYWFKFVPGDWLKDPELRSVSSGARGLWIDMLSLMFDSVRRGYLKLNNGNVVTAELLARMTGNSTDDTSHWLQELDYSGVLSRTDDGCIYNRRMVKEQAERTKNYERVTKHRCNANETGDETPISNSNSLSEFDVGSKESKSKTKPSRKKACRLPEDFIPQPEHYELAKSLEINCEMEYQKFRDYYLGIAGPKGLKLDWPATLRNWLRNSINYQKGGGNGTRQTVRTSAAATRQANTQQAIINSITNLSRSRDGDYCGEQQDGNNAGIERRNLPAVRGTSAGGN